MKLRLLLFTIISIILIAGCGKKEIKPVAINEQSDKCEVCHMAVKDDGFATEVILENGKALLFDDIGCMYKWMGENEGKEVANSYVKDYDSKEWLELEKASFVYDKPIKTPMAYNVIAFSDEKAAKSFIEEHGSGDLLSYEKLQHHSWERNQDMVKEMKEKMQGHGNSGEMDMNGSSDQHDMNKGDSDSKH
ncbi:nitrous oxide reductase accessory protein NosL [Bacillus sp. FJAT-29814]|uniref:nitrous oxide reductase accessory protein NosL n=1 Tax=Bacillus sp. FJAT-29814 TaxID=1729688 RepID=UPI00082D5774|nr:nitrous oxide reductase accessory protein NosL [Bacillus sp. FJAT-29814]